MGKKLKAFILCTICILFMSIDTGHVFAGTPNAYESPFFDGTIQQYHNNHFTVKEGVYGPAKDFAVRKFVVSNLILPKNENESELISLTFKACDSDLYTTDYIKVWLIRYKGAVPYCGVSVNNSTPDSELLINGYETESLVGVNGTISISFERGTIIVKIDRVSDSGSHEVFTKLFPAQSSSQCLYSNIGSTTINGNIKAYK